MKATLESIFEDMNELEKIMRKIGNEPKRINADEIMIMATSLAFLVYEVRRKYELTSGYYCIAEDQAQKKYNMIYD